MNHGALTPQSPYGAAPTTIILSIFKAVLQGNHVYPIPLVFFLCLFRNKTFGGKCHKLLYRQDAIPDTQLAVSQHSKQVHTTSLYNQQYQRTAGISYYWPQTTDFIISHLPPDSWVKRRCYLYDASTLYPQWHRSQ